MKSLHNPFAIIGICVSLLGSLASFDLGAREWSARDGQRASEPHEQAHAWIVLDGFGSSSTIDSAHTGASPQRGALHTQPAPIRGENEIDEDLDQDPGSLPGLGHWQLVEAVSVGRLTRTSATPAVLGAHSSRGPPRA